VLAKPADDGGLRIAKLPSLCRMRPVMATSLRSCIANDLVELRRAERLRPIAALPSDLPSRSRVSTCVICTATLHATEYIHERRGWRQAEDDVHVIRSASPREENAAKITSLVSEDPDQDIVEFDVEKRTPIGRRPDRVNEYQSR
jgi:hypothetical protein